MRFGPGLLRLTTLAIAFVLDSTPGRLGASLPCFRGDFVLYIPSFIVLPGS